MQEGGEGDWEVAWGKDQAVSTLGLLEDSPGDGEPSGSATVPEAKEKWEEAPGHKKARFGGKRGCCRKQQARWATTGGARQGQGEWVEEGQEDDLVFKGQSPDSAGWSQGGVEMGEAWEAGVGWHLGASEVGPSGIDREEGLGEGILGWGADGATPLLTEQVGALPWSKDEEEGGAGLGSRGPSKYMYARNRLVGIMRQRKGGQRRV
ncbi:hypothetical protein NDU88_001622 [Pleurodeles waltl]|uniref:Uncharacterized protein n=1 Tax=Pleurodeles waltl TaxID=8319 RepID=A0AAV7WIV8_PLEWA|nr:hypothetical protein NDU88_001622 [Pleurodeles waltl]